MKRHKKTILVCGIIFIAFILMITIAVFLISRNLQNYLNEQSGTNDVSVNSIEDNSPVVDTGVTWIEPQALEDLKLLSVGKEDSQYAKVDYYKIAELQDQSQLILAKAASIYSNRNVLFRFKKDPQGNYFYLANESTLGTQYDSVSAYLANNSVTFDEKTYYDSLHPNPYLSVYSIPNSRPLTIADSEGLFQDLKSPQMVGQTKWGEVYKIFLSTNGNETGPMGYYLKLADSTYRSYYSDFPNKNEDSEPIISWNDGSQNESYYQTRTPFCETCDYDHDNYVILNTKNINQRLNEIGENGNDKIYFLSNNDPAMIEIYNNYKQNTKNPMSLENFLIVKPFFIFKNDIGDYLIFTNERYSYSDIDSGEGY